MELVVLSGKGGVGKTMIASSLALLFKKEKQKIVCLDADVDASNLHLWFGGVDFTNSKALFLTKQAVIDQKKCIHCGRCQQNCFFSAVEKIKGTFKIKPFSCEGCGVCQFVCPVGAVALKRQQNAFFKSGTTKSGIPLLSAQLLPGQTGSGKIVDFLKEQAEKQPATILLIDAPAGTSCPVIAAVKDADFALLVTEPTPSGFADLKQAFGLVDNFKIPFGLVINKFDINKTNSQAISRWAERHQARFISTISYDQKIFQALSNLTPITDTNLKARKEIEVIYANLKKITE